MKSKMLLVFDVTFGIGIVIAILVLETRGINGLYILAAGTVIIARILLEQGGRGRQWRKAIAAGLVLPIGAMTAGSALGHAHMMTENATSDVTMHVFVAIVALLLVYTWMWKLRGV